MKKYFSLTLAVIFVLSACTSKRSLETVRIGAPAQSFIADLSQEDAARISDILKDKTWQDGTGDCLNDYMMLINGKTIYYHSDCGTFNDTKNEKSFSLDDGDKAKVNKTLAKYIKFDYENDTIPIKAVMVGGKLYYATETESSVTARCGVMDGEITSSVDETRIPVQNNQSNFGTGYGYQYGKTNEVIEVLIDGKWYIFATIK